MKLRLSNHLIVFGLICLAPVVLAVVLVGWDLASKERARLEQQTVILVDQYQRDIDADLTGVSGMLQALATARTLDHEDWATFHAQADVVALKAGAPIVLRDLEGRHLVSTVVPAGQVPNLVTTDQVLRSADRRAIATQAPALSDLFRGVISGRAYVALVVPVVREGAVRYLLSVGFNNDRVVQKLRPGALPTSRWLSTVVGSDLRVIARTRDLDAFVGSSATGELARRLHGDESGTLVSQTLDGVAVYTAFRRTELGWTVLVSAPLDELHRPLRTLVLVLVSIVGAVLLVTVLMAWTYGRMLGREVTTLALNARALGQDTPIYAPMRPYGQHIVEVAEVQQALFDAQSKVEALIAELNHRVKNTLTVIKVLASRSVSDRQDREAVTARISALTVAHEALTETHWGGADLGKLVQAIARSADAAVTCTGPAVRLTPKAAVALAQVAQELVSNATTHGALRDRSGRVDLAWHVSDERLHVTWVERSPQRPQPPNRAAGFGLKIIELCILRQLGGELAMDRAPEGWTLSFSFPLAGELGVMVETDPAAASAAQEPGQSSRQA